MVDTYQTANTIGSGTRFTFTATEDTYTVLEGVTVATTDGTDAVFGTQGGQAVYVDGTVAGGPRAINLSGGDNRVAVSADGVVRGNDTFFDGIGVFFGRLDADNQLVNEGQIVGNGADGVLAHQVDITNTGTISGRDNGVFVGLFGGTGSTVLNSGTITGGADDNSQRLNSGVFSEGDDTVIVNAAGGVISSIADMGAGVRIGDGISGSGDGSSVENHGLITATFGIGVDFSEMFDTDTASLTNFGTISGGTASFSGNASGERVDNGGTMIGDVLMGLGDDTYRGLGDGEVAGRVFGQGGSDTIIGGNQADTLDGGSGDDELRGRDGEDTLFGRTGEDTIFGGDGDDAIFGNQNDDVLFGGDGNDTLDGGQDNDVLRAGNGDDTLEGGLGRDVLISGSGEDVFFYQSIAASGVGGAARDAIRDFEQGEDVIDLESIAGGGLRFIGDNAFSGTQAEVRVINTTGGSTVVRVDEDGDGVRDMEILVQFTTDLEESDFVL